MTNEESAICPETLEQAYSSLGSLGGVGSLNPFNPAFEFRRLDRPAGEPFYTGDFD